jgi:thymidylate synthase (FAD)
MMEVKLLHNTPLWVASKAIRKCWASEGKSDTFIDDRDGAVVCGTKDKELIERIGNKLKHKSTLRHVTYIFDCSDVSTKTLLALTRHCVGKDISVESTRYTTSKRSDKLSFTETPNPAINKSLEVIMDLVQGHIQAGHSNDDISMLLPQAYNYSFIMTMNIQSLQHFLELRTKRDAHYDIRKLANALFEQIPEDHSYLFKHYLSTDDV